MLEGPGHMRMSPVSHAEHACRAYHLRCFAWALLLGRVPETETGLDMISEAGQTVTSVFADALNVICE